MKVIFKLVIETHKDLDKDLLVADLENTLEEYNPIKSYVVLEEVK